MSEEDYERRLEFRKQLLRLSNDLTDSDVKKLKFLCSDLPALPRRDLETITTGFELFTALEGIEELSPDKLDTLEQLLKALKRGRLLRPLKEALPPRPANAAPPLSDVTSDPVPSIKFNQCLITVGEDLPKRELDNVIYFFRNSGLPAQVLENLQEPCELFDLLKQERIISQADLSQLRAILHDIGKLGTCAKIDEYTQSVQSDGANMCVAFMSSDSGDLEVMQPPPAVRPPVRPPSPTDQVTDKRVQEIVDQALESGSVQVRKVVAVITGLMGSGKTWLLSRLFHRPPPNLYTSTGIAEQSYRGFLNRINSMSWNLLSHKDIREFLAPLFLAGMTEANVASLATELIAMDTATTTSFSVAFPPPLQETPPEAASHSSKPLALSKVSPTYQAMVRLVSQTTASKKHVSLELVHMIDTGGNPVSMEMMPSLIHHANLAVMVLNLMYGLDEYPPIHFHNSGTASHQKMLSQHTNRQVILQLAVTLRSKRFSRNIFRILIVATHQDCVEGDLAARVDALNRELSTLLFPLCKDALIPYSTSGQIAFVVNLKEPAANDEKTLECLRKTFGECGVVVNVPGSFFMYEQDLVRYAGDMQRDVLSIDECLQVGDRLKMDGEVVVAALVFFHRQNTFLYFRHILPNVVFINPQVPLNVANAIVRFSYKVSNDAYQGLPAKFISLLKRGIITEELLQHYELSSCFVPGFYEPRHAIELLSHTFSLTPLSHDQQQNKTSPQQPTTLPQGTGEREYLMMCLLPTIPDHDLPHYIPPSADIEPLVVKFSGDCVPLGCFSRTISCLLSTFNWRISRAESGSPECLAHNIVSLYDPTLPAAHIVLLDLSHHLEIHIDARKANEKIPPKICLCVQETLFAAISEVLNVMQLSGIEVSPAFLCTDQRASICSVPVRELEYEQFCPCSTSTKRVCVADIRHNVWKETPENETDKPYLPELIELQIHHRVGSKYRDFGTLLLNDQNGCVVDNLEIECYYKPDRIACRILQKWIKGEGRAVSWHTLISTLKDCQLNALAEDIAKSKNINMPLDQTNTVTSDAPELPAEEQPAEEQPGVSGPRNTPSGSEDNSDTEISHDGNNTSQPTTYLENKDQNLSTGLRARVFFICVKLIGNDIILALFCILLAVVFAAIANHVYAINPDYS